MLAAAIPAFFVIREFGQNLAAPSGPVQTATASAAPGDTLLRLLLALLVIITASRLLGALFRWLHQPAVIGEVVAGITLGPSILGQFAPHMSGELFPGSVVPLLSALAQLGVIIFMFVVGVDFDTGLLRKKGHAALAISHASIVAPLLLGATLALWLYPRVAPPGVRFDVFALFIGVAMSITAFPVLARILKDRGLHSTNLGVLALSCAAVDDVTAWCLLALVLGIAKSSAESVVLTLTSTLLYMGAMFGVLRPLIQKFVRAQELRGTVAVNDSALALIGLIVSATTAEWIGVHAIFGAFIMGTMIPHDSRLAETLRHRLSDVALVLLLPAFFAFTGLRTQIALVSGVEAWLMCAVIIVVACVGKLGGGYLAARVMGVSRVDSASVGILMNTRGLMELVVLNIGLDLGVISPELFAMMVLMALVTTFATSPLLSLMEQRMAIGVHVAPRRV